MAPPALQRDNAKQSACSTLPLESVGWVSLYTGLLQRRRSFATGQISCSCGAEGLPLCRTQTGVLCVCCRVYKLDPEKGCHEGASKPTVTCGSGPSQRLLSCAAPGVHAGPVWDSGRARALGGLHDHRSVKIAVSTCVHGHVTSQAEQQSSPQSFDRPQRNLERLLRC